MKKQTSSPNLKPKEDSKTTVPPSEIKNSHQSSPGAIYWEKWLPLSWLVVATGCGHNLCTGHNWLNASNYGLEDQMAEHINILQRRSLMQAAWKTNVANSSPATYQTTAARRNWRRWPHFSCRLDSHRASARLFRLLVRGTGNKEIFGYQPSVNRYSLSVEKISFINEFQHV